MYGWQEEPRLVSVASIVLNFVGKYHASDVWEERVSLEVDGKFLDAANRGTWSRPEIRRK